MLSYSTIQQIAKDAADEARELCKVPYSIRQYSGNVESFCRRIPFLGDYVPEGWERVPEIEPLFVDSSGFGSAGEPALTLAEFSRKLAAFKKSGDNYGFAIIEAGQFQVYIAVYRPDSRDFTHSGALTRAEFSHLR